MAHGTQAREEINLQPLREALEANFNPVDYQEGQELILGACQEAQHFYGYVPREAAQLIADHLGVTINRIYGLLTFYADFRTEPPGRHFMLLCHGAACYVMGSQRLVDDLQHRYGVTNDGTTSDDAVTLQVVNGCLGVCDMAPVAQIDHHTYCGHLDSDRLAKVMDTLKRGESLEEIDDVD